MALRDELAVLDFLTCDLKVFVCPQFDVGKCPDFVALDFSRNQIVVVEVTARSQPSTFRNSVNNRRADWYRPIQQVLLNWPVGSWPIRFLGFVRNDQVRKLSGYFASDDDVTICEIPGLLHEFHEWRGINGLPDKHLGLYPP